MAQLFRSVPSSYKVPGSIPGWWDLNNFVVGTVGKFSAFQLQEWTQILNNYTSLSVQQQRNISDILSGSPGTSSKYQLSIPKAVILNSTKTAQKSTAQQPLTLFSGTLIHGGTFNIFLNALNRNPTLSMYSPKSKKPRCALSSTRLVLKMFKGLSLWLKVGKLAFWAFWSLIF